MKRICTLLIFLVLVGCGESADTVGVNSVCSFDGRAYYVKRNGGDSMFLYRTPDADPLCEKLKTTK